MPSTSQPKRPAQFVPGKSNVVTAVTGVDLVMVRFVNADGRECLCLALAAGTDTEDGDTGVYVLADEDQLNQQLKIAGPVVKAGVREYLARKAPADADSIPDSPLEPASPDDIPSLPV